MLDWMGFVISRISTIFMATLGWRSAAILARARTHVRLRRASPRDAAAWRERTLPWVRFAAPSLADAGDAFPEPTMTPDTSDPATESLDGATPTPAAEPPPAGADAPRA